MDTIDIHVYNNYAYIQNDFRDIPDCIIEACTLKETTFRRTRFIRASTHQDAMSYYYRAKNMNLGPKKPRFDEKNGQYHLYLKKHMSVSQEKEHSFFDITKKKFPTGWLFLYVVEVLEDKGIPYNITDKRKKPETKEIPFTDEIDKFDFSKKYNYQPASVHEALKRTRGVLRLATGAGKTLIASMLIQKLGTNTLFIVPNKDLLYQARNEFVKLFGQKHVGIVGDGLWETKLITVATAQTIWSRRRRKETKALLDSIKVVIIDECHAVSKSSQNKKNRITNTWWQIVMQCKNAYYRIGLSATPGEEGTIQFELLRAATGGIIFDMPANELIKRGVLSSVVVHMYEIEMEKITSHWQHIYTENIVENRDRNNIIAQLADKYAKQGKRVIISTDRKESHIKPIVEFLNEDYKIVHGDITGKEREQIFNDFRDGDFYILIGTVLKEGLDIKNAEVLINAAGMKSKKNTLQKAGRVLRTAEGKDNAIIIDFFDKDNGKMQDWSNERIQSYTRAEYPIEYKKLNSTAKSKDDMGFSL